MVETAGASGASVSPQTSGVHDIGDMNGPVPRMSPPGDPNPGTGPGTSFKRRKIDVKITLANKGAAFTESPHGDENTIALSGLRVYASITYEGATHSDANVRIFGMTQSHMEQLSMLGLQRAEFQSLLNVIRISAGEVPMLATGQPAPAALPGEKPRAVLSDVFTGIINSAHMNLQDMPEVSFDLTAYGQKQDALASAEPTSYEGDVDAVMILSNLAMKMGMDFRNWGVPKTPIHSPYYPNTLWDQAMKVAQQANIYMAPDPTTRALEIWPIGGYRGRDVIPVISSDTGMVGYPVYSEDGLIVKTLFNPLIRFGSRVQVRTSLKQRKVFKDGIYACGIISHSLASEAPGGEWFTSLACLDPTFPGIPGTLFG